MFKTSGLAKRVMLNDFPNIKGQLRLIFKSITNSWSRKHYSQRRYFIRKINGQNVMS